MNIFVINSGSSSIKYQLISMPAKTVICSGIVERIGLGNSTITHKTFVDGKVNVIVETQDIVDHAAGLQEVARLLTDPTIGVISDPSEITAVGHRVVHGGESFAATTIITPVVKEEIKKLFPLAPLHNPPNYLGIEVAEKIFTKAKQVAVFDTAFHHTLPAKAYRFAIPAEFYHTHGIRAYGFHGTSHKYVSEQAIQYLGKQHSKIITIHLGNGCSMTAVENGQCVDTSMGLGPMNGLMMGTRSGDIDQSVIFHMVNQLGYDLEQVNSILNKKSGMFGLTGYSDMRDIRKEIEKGNPEAILAYDMYAYRIRKFIGAYAAVLNGLDAIVFTGGVGENDAILRKMVAENFEYLGIVLDVEKNNLRIDGIHEINTKASKVKILVVPTNEELEIANQCFRLLGPSVS
jgi:acetate kinase